MKIEFSSSQLELLKSVIAEYADDCYHSMFEYQHIAIEAPDEAIKKEYALLAQSEETRFNDIKKLSEYIEKYEELMRGTDE